jgi:hypothetical protein
LAIINVLYERSGIDLLDGQTVFYLEWHIIPSERSLQNALEHLDPITKPGVFRIFQVEAWRFANDTPKYVVYLTVVFTSDLKGHMVVSAVVIPPWNKRW